MIVIAAYASTDAARVSGTRDQNRPIRFYRYRANDERPSFQKPVTMDGVADNSGGVTDAGRVRCYCLAPLRG